MISTDQVERLLREGTVVSSTGEKIGKVGQVFLDDRTGNPEWVTVRTGLFGTAESFVPLTDADVQGDEIRVPFGKDQVKDAPRVDDAEGHLSEDEEAELYRYYGRAQTTDEPGAPGTSDQDDRTDEAGVVGRHAAGPATDDTAARSEQDPSTRPDDDAAGRVRLRRYVVTEYVTQTVPGEQSGTGSEGVGEERTVRERVREEIVETDGEENRP
ncbi:PRC-barrel domain-containing protein [Cellulosimicrobium sp. Marseille-Q4280]|uniref:PRC-barrel domain-containing protein n=1 Tax=Cellulosimicrobium sp. Marseille-Q4280 TaxID=2937992 RepID=UPI00204268BA|nr:PRC-barrel domain-containing protein [Cellulosimicrobium sp. Marseille-Q4280]